MLFTQLIRIRLQRIDALVSYYLLDFIIKLSEELIHWSEANYVAIARICDVFVANRRNTISLKCVSFQIRVVVSILNERKSIHNWLICDRNLRNSSWIISERHHIFF